MTWTRHCTTFARQCNSKATHDKATQGMEKQGKQRKAPDLQRNMLLHTIAKDSKSWQHKLQRLDCAGQLHGINLCKMKQHLTTITTSASHQHQEHCNHISSRIPHDINIWTSACLHVNSQIPFYKPLSIPAPKFMGISYIQYKHHISIQIIFEQKP